MIVAVIAEAVVIVVLSMLCHSMYADVLRMARNMAGMPEKSDISHARIISPYRKQRGDDGS